MNWAQFKDPVSHMCLTGAVVACWSLKFFVTEFAEFSEKHLGKTPLSFSISVELRTWVCNIPRHSCVKRTNTEAGGLLTLIPRVYITSMLRFVTLRKKQKRHCF